MDSVQTSVNDLESELWSAVAEGRPLLISPDPSGGAAKIDAALIARILMTPPPGNGARTPALILKDVEVVGLLDLSYARIPVPFLLTDCNFTSGLNLASANMQSTTLESCRLAFLEAKGLRVQGDLLLRGIIADRLSLGGASVDGDLVLSGAKFLSSNVRTVEMSMMTVAGAVRMCDVEIHGCLNIEGASAVTLDLARARLGKQDEFLALEGDGLRLERDLHGVGLQCDGGVRLFGASIGGQLWLNDARIKASTRWAVSAPLIVIGGGLYASGLQAEGGLNLFAARIGESLELQESSLARPHLNLSLRAPRIDIGGDVYLQGLKSLGSVDLSASKIAGVVSLDDTSLSSTNFNARRSQLGELDMRRVTEPALGLDLSGSSVTTIKDDPAAWPRSAKFNLLTYQGIEPPLDAKERLNWLGRNADGYEPQPYEHLASFYRRLGRDRDARTVLLAARRRQRGLQAPSARAWGLVEDAVVGYGYRPTRALAWISLLLICVTTVFWVYPPAPVRDPSPVFHPGAYALDLILPVLDLGQQNAYAPGLATRWVAWMSILLGWLLATALLTSVTRNIAKP